MAPEGVVDCNLSSVTVSLVLSIALAETDAPRGAADAPPAPRAAPDNTLHSYNPCWPYGFNCRRPRNAICISVRLSPVAAVNKYEIRANLRKTTRATHAHREAERPCRIGGRETRLSTCMWWSVWSSVGPTHERQSGQGQGARRVALHTVVAHTLSSHRTAVGSSGRPARKASKLFSARSYSSEVCPKPGASPASSPASPARSTSSSAANASFS